MLAESLCQNPQRLGNRSEECSLARLGADKYGSPGNGSLSPSEAVLLNADGGSGAELWVRVRHGLRLRPDAL